MTIFFCTTTFQSVGNGPSKFAQILLELNDRENVEFHLFTEDVKASDTSSHIHKVDLSKNTLESRIGMIARIKDYTSTILQFSKQYEPSVIVFNNAILGHQLYKGRTPCLGMINDDNSVDASLSTDGFSYKYIRHRIFRYYESQAVRNATGIISNSNMLTEKFVKGYQANRKKIHRLYKAVNTDVETIKRKTLEDKVSILFVKSDFERGGLFDLIEAANLINKQIAIHIVGPESTSFKRITEANKNSNTSLRLHGRLEQKQIFSLMHKCDIFCTPSKKEALGVANMEALIHKLPVVYTRVGGIPEVMNYGQNGFEAEASNSESLAEAIISCIVNDNERIEKTENGYSFVKQYFDKDAMLNNFINICKSTI